MYRKRCLRKPDDKLAKIINEKTEAFKKYVSIRTIEKEIDYKQKIHREKEVRRRHKYRWYNFFTKSETDIRRPQPKKF
jgi:hypothetical protein